MKDVFVVVASRSEIISQGVRSMLLAVEPDLDVSLALSFDEVEHALKRHRDAHCVIFISNRLFGNRDDEFLHLRNTYQAYWVGVVVDPASRNVQSVFDDLLYLDDSQEHMRHILEGAHQIIPAENQGSFDKSMLSDRELDVLKLLVEGSSNKEIANKLFISTHTVISHRKNISQKTGIKSVSGLTIFAVLNKLVTVDNYFDIE
jgi:DNA-binding NarL/FixJ family response regulator